MNFLQAIKLYEEQTSNTSNKMQTHDQCCEQETSIIDSFRTCLKCGKAVEEFVYIVQAPSCVLTNRAVYKRVSYFKHLLQLICCRKQSHSPKYNPMLEHLRTMDFSTIQELRALMKEHGYHKFYPYMFVIFYDIKNQKLVELTCSEVSRFERDFVRIERSFKVLNQGKRKTMLSYSFIIKSLLKRYKKESHQHVMVPSTSAGLQKQLDSFLST